jgi:ankyrin repeat protein
MHVAFARPQMKLCNIWMGILFTLLFTQSAAFADYDSFEKEAIAMVKAMPTSEIEAGRSAQPFEVWLKNLAGKGATLKWELNDCGEGTGGPADQERDMPLCVAVDAKLPDGRWLYVSLGVANASDEKRAHLPGGAGIRDVFAGYKDESFTSGSGLNPAGALFKLEEFLKVDARSIGLYYAATKGDVLTAQAMLKQGVDIHSGYGEKALFTAAENGQLPLVRLLLNAAGFDVNARRMDGETVLSATTRWRGQYYPKEKSEEPTSSAYLVGWDSYFEIVQLLVARGADTYSKNRALANAANRQDQRSRQLDIVRFLLKAGADVNCKENPLWSAAGQSNVEVIRALLEAGANINVASAHESVVNESVRDGSEEGMLLLLEHGADVNPKNGDPPLIAAVRIGSVGKSKILLEHGADINATDIGNFTPLMEAAKYGRLDIAKMLIEKGADLNRHSSSGYTALSLAIEQHHPQIATMLRKAGAKK